MARLHLRPSPNEKFQMTNSAGSISLFLSQNNVYRSIVRGVKIGRPRFPCTQKRNSSLFTRKMKNIFFKGRCLNHQDHMSMALVLCVEGLGLIEGKEDTY